MTNKIVVCPVQIMLATI